MVSRAIELGKSDDCGVLPIGAGWSISDSALPRYQMDALVEEDESGTEVAAGNWRPKRA